MDPVPQNGVPVRITDPLKGCPNRTPASVRIRTAIERLRSVHKKILRVNSYYINLIILCL
jgi:hypothetical protein